MKKVLLKILNAPWYWATFAAYPILSLLANNISQVRWTAGIRPALVSVIGAGLFFLLFRLLYRSWYRAAFATLALTILFFTYGQVYNLLFEKKFPHLSLLLGGTWIILLGLALFWATRKRTSFRGAALVLNVISLGLCVYSIYVVIQKIPPAPKASAPAAPNAPVESLNPPADESKLPDIYYFILDSYGRSDLLKENVDFDNSEFIKSLEKTGFYVAGCSQSNYPRTDVSLGSSLNMDYLQDLNPAKYTTTTMNRSALWQSILHSTVSAELHNAGYKTVAFATGFAFTEVTSADVYISPSPVISPLTEFEILAMKTTPLRHLQDAGLVNLDAIDGQRFRERTLLALSSMDRVSRMPGPKFVFVHMVIPHPPFVFGSNGSPTDPAQFLNADNLYPQDKYYRGIRNEATYIDAQMEKVVATILSHSAVPPVIVIQGDHAPWLQTGSDMFKILNAYYLPGHEDMLYPSISPVNTFRVIFNAYLGGHYPLLPDISYYSPIPYVFNFSQASNPCEDK